MRNLQPIRGESKQDMRRLLPIVFRLVWMQVVELYRDGAEGIRQAAGMTG